MGFIYEHRRRNTHNIIVLKSYNDNDINDSNVDDCRTIQERTKVDETKSLSRFCVFRSNNTHDFKKPK